MSSIEVFETRDRIKAWLVQEGLFKEEVPQESFPHSPVGIYPLFSLKTTRT
jgi:hypothetical protein